MVEDLPSIAERYADDETHEFTEDSGEDTELVSAVENGVFEAQYYGVSEELSECVGYALQDMNTDGMPELVVCAIAEEKGGKSRGVISARFIPVCRMKSIVSAPAGQETM